MKKTLISLLAICAVISCSKENFNDSDSRSGNSDNSESVGEMTSLGAELADSEEDAKTFLKDEDGNRFIRWSNYDKIGIVGVSGTTATVVTGFIDNSSIGDKSASFNYVTAKMTGKTIKYGFYPFTPDAKVGGGGTSLTISLPTNQKYMGSAGVFAPDVAIMAAKLTSNKLKFLSACGYLKLNVTGSGRIMRIQLRSEKSPLSGEGTVSLSATTPSFKLRTASEHFINLDLGEGVQLSSTATPLYFVMAPGTYDDLCLYAITDDGSIIRSSIKSHTIAVRTIHPMNDIDLKVEAPSDYVNLSADGTANCYVVAPDQEKTYGFDLKKVDGTNIGGGYYADYIWATAEGLVGNVRYDGINNRIYFDKKGTEAGSALLSLYDADDEVIWSWHIWMTDTKNQKIKTPAGECMFMDRNLGATYSPSSKAEKVNMTKEQSTETYGFLYQFGNNIPFPGAADCDAYHGRRYECGDDGSQEPFISNTYTRRLYFNPNQYRTVPFTRFERATLSLTAEMMASRPTTFNKVQTPGQQLCNSWATDVTSHDANAGWKEKKTNTDPCPAGYRVPLYKEIFGFCNSDLANPAETRVMCQHDPAQRLYDGVSKSDGRNYSDGANLYYLGSSDTEFLDEQFVYIPLAGFRTSGYNDTSSGIKSNWFGTLGSIGSSYYSSEAWTKSSTAQFWAAEKTGDNAEVMLTLTPYHTFNTSMTGDVYQRVLDMVGFFSDDNGEDGRKYRIGSFSDKDHVHAISSALSVRCVKIK